MTFQENTRKTQAYVWRKGFNCLRIRSSGLLLWAR